MTTNDPGKSCFGCPSLLQPTDSGFFRKSIGVPVCARFGKPIGKMSSTRGQQEKIAKHFASTCPEYGEPKPHTPDWDKAKFQVMLPDPEIIGKPRVSPEMVNSCAGCKFFVREDVVARDLGWSSALCSAKGKLLLANRYTLEARACTEKDFGTVRSDTNGLTFVPEYDDDFVGSADPVKAFAKLKANFVDPTEYETDQPVSVEDEAVGIRAWRRITDPATDNSIFMPIFRRDFFSPDEQKLIPKTGDDEHPEDYVDHNFYVYKVGVLWMELDETPAFWGKAGTGKTEFFRHMAYLMQLPFHRFSITGSTEKDDLAGKMKFTEGIGTHFEDGRFAKAWTTPCVMVVDEYNVGQPDVQQYLRPCIDNSKQLVQDEDNGRHLDRHAFAFLGVAMNPAWDILNVGTNVIGDADANRLMHLSIDLPPKQLEEEIITKRCEHDGWVIPADTLQMVMSIAADIRGLTDNNTLPISWAIRPQLKVARALRWFDPITSYKMASADYLDPEQQQMLLDVVRTHMDGSI